MTRSCRLLATAVAALLALPPTASAQFLRPDDVVSAEILPGWRQADGTHVAALRLTLQDGWKTYWRVPGEAGIPPRFDWTGSRNVGSVRILWPRPETFDQNGFLGIGYDNALVLPLELTPREAGGRMTVQAVIDIGVCNDICMPVTLTLDATLGMGGRPDPRIQAALADRPETPAEAGVRGLHCTMDPTGSGLRVTASIDMPALGGDEVAVFETVAPDVWVEHGPTARDGGRLRAEAVFETASGAPVSLDRSGLSITVIGASRAVTMAGCPAG